jgi:HK97 family phage portal protein
MALLDFLKYDRKESKIQEQLSKLLTAQLTHLGANSAIWQPFNFESLLEQAYQKNPDVYSVINFLSKKMSNVPLCAYDSEGNKIEYEPLERVKDQPNSYQSFDDFLANLYSNYLLTGNGYIYCQKGETAITEGRILLVEALPSVYIEAISGKSGRGVAEYRFTEGYINTKMDAENVIHIKNVQMAFGSGEHLYGQSPLQAAFKSIQTSNSGYDSQKASMDNQGAAGILYNKGIDFAGGKDAWTQDEINEMRQSIKEVRKNSNSNSIGVGVGDLGYINFGITPVDMGIMEVLDLSLSDVCNAYNLPVGLFNNNDSSTFSNQEQYRKQAYTDSILPTLNKFEYSFNRLFMNDEGVYFKFDTSEIPELQADKKDQVSALSGAYWMTPNEKREMMGLAAIEDADMNQVYVPSSLTPIDLSGFEGEE